MTTTPATISGQPPAPTTTPTTARPQPDAGLDQAVAGINAALVDNAHASGVPLKSPARSAAARARPRGPGGVFAPKSPPDPNQAAPEAHGNAAAPGAAPADFVPPPSEGAGDGSGIAPDGAAMPEDAAARESLGRVIVDGVNNVADGLGGSDLKPTPAEKESLDHYLGRAMGGVTIPAIAAVAIVAAAWLARVWIKRRREAANRTTHAPTTPTGASDASSDRRPDPQREVDLGTPIGFANLSNP